MNSRDIGRDISGEEFSATEETYKFRDSIYGDTTGQSEQLLNGESTKVRTMAPPNIVGNRPDEGSDHLVSCKENTKKEPIEEPMDIDDYNINVTLERETKLVTDRKVGAVKWMFFILLFLGNCSFSVPVIKNDG